jgi:hypothetical protein
MRYKTDEALIREVMSDRDVSPREKEIARRLFQLGQAFDELERLDLQDIQRGEVWHGTVH